MTEPQRRMDGYGPEDLAIPTWGLLQKTGGEWAKELGGKPGQFHNSGSDEIVDELNIIVADILIGRARWSEEISDAGPQCASQDAKSHFSINGDDCNECPYRLDNAAAVEASERRKMCCLNYTILGFTIDDYMPCIIRAHGSSALPVRKLLTSLLINRELKGQFWRARVNIKSQEKTGKYGSFFVLHPILSELITDEQKLIELKSESYRVLGAPIPLLEERPQEVDLEPLGFTPEGIPFYSEAERDRLMGDVKVLPAAPAEAAPAEAAAVPSDRVGKQIEKIAQATAAADQAAAAKVEPAKEAKEPEPVKEPEAEKKAEPEKKLDLDF